MKTAHQSQTSHSVQQDSDYKPHRNDRNQDLTFHTWKLHTTTATTMTSTTEHNEFLITNKWRKALCYETNSCSQAVDKIIKWSRVLVKTEESESLILIIPRSHSYCPSLSLCLEWYNGSITPRVHSGVIKPAQCRLHYDRTRQWNKCVKPVSGLWSGISSFVCHSLIPLQTVV